MLGLKTTPTPGRCFGFDTSLFDGELDWVREAVYDVDVQSRLAAQAGLQTGRSHDPPVRRYLLNQTGQLSRTDLAVHRDVGDGLGASLLLRHSHFGCHFVVSSSCARRRRNFTQNPLEVQGLNQHTSSFWGTEGVFV